MKREPRGAHFEYFVGKLEQAGARYYSGDDWFCPAHDDGTRGSLGLREAADGSVLMHCMGGCSNKDILKAAGMTLGDFYPKKSQRYIYTDGEGNKLYCVVRYYKNGKKQLAHKVYEPSHEKADKAGFAAYPQCMDGVERVLFRLPRVLEAAERGMRLFIVGGEKDARAIIEQWGEAATTNSGGEGQKWREEWTEQIRGVSEVIVIPDRDPKGHAHAIDVYDALSNSGVRVRIGFSRVKAKGSDASDHIMDGGGVEDLEWVDREDLEGEVDLKDYTDTDTGSAERLAALFGTRIRFVQRQRTWLVWDGCRWAEDEPQVHRMCTALHRELYSQYSEQAIAAGASGDKEAKKWWRERARWALQGENSGRARNVLERARHLEGMSTYPKEYDRDPWAFNVLNGTIDLRTGRIRPHNRGDLNRKVSAVEFDPSATAPVWQEFLEMVVPDKGVRKFLCYYIGMCLTGKMLDHVFPVMYGKGRNGKSTFLNAVMALFGDYAQSLPSDTLRQKGSGGGIPNDVARLEGARLALASEFPEGGRINEDLLKRLTGGDPVVARFLNQEFFEFYPTAKFILATNHKPEFRGADDGVWRRVRLVPFTVSIPVEDVDPDLGSKLAAELPGILNWAIKGCLNWQRHGLYMPTSMARVTEEYREESDLIGQFLEEYATFGPEEECQASVLYSEFRMWMEEQGQKPWTQTTFGRAVGGRAGIERGKDPKNRRVIYTGISVGTVRKDGP